MVWERGKVSSTDRTEGCSNTVVSLHMKETGWNIEFYCLPERQTVYVVLLVSPGDWLPTFLWLVQEDFHVPSSNSEIKKGPSVLLPSLPPLLQSFVLMVSNPNSSSLMCSGFAGSIRYHVLILPSACSARSCFLLFHTHWQAYCPSYGTQTAFYSTPLFCASIHQKILQSTLRKMCCWHIGSRRCTQTVLLVFFLLHRFFWAVLALLFTLLTRGSLQRRDASSWCHCTEVRPFCEQLFFAGDCGQAWILPKSVLK